jgi:lysophospholipase L1-like esterase
MVKHEFQLYNACNASKRIEDSVVNERDTLSRGSGRLIAFLGDSWAQGAEIENPLDAFPYRTVSLTGDSAWVDAKQGTGYTNPGPCKNELLQDRVDSVLAKKPDILIIAAGLNDSVRDGRLEAVDRLFARISSNAPPRVIVLGAFDPPTAKHRAVAEMSETLDEEAQRYGFQFVSVENWADSYVSDQIHPDSASRQRIAERLAGVIESSLP